jgi:hypothetical protein
MLSLFLLFFTFMEKTALFFFAVILLGFSACDKGDKPAQGPSFNTLLNKTFGGSFADPFNSVALTPDGGCIMAGSTFSFDGDITVNHGNFDGFIVKVNSAGNKEWSNTVGGKGYEYITKIITTPDGGYLIAGTLTGPPGDPFETHNGSYDAWIAKLDNTGNIEWTRSFGGSADETARDVILTQDGGYLFAGFASSNNGDVSGKGLDDAWVVKLSKTGSIQWSKTIGGSGDDGIWALCATQDGSFLLAGQTNSTDGNVPVPAGNQDGLLVKINNDGVFQWAKTYGGPTADKFMSIASASDGFVAGGSSAKKTDPAGNLGDYDAWVVKVGQSGELQWNKTFGGSAEDIALSIITIPGNNYLVATHSDSKDGDISGNHGDYDVLMLHLNNKGEKIKSALFGGAGFDYPQGLVRTADNKYILAGATPNSSSSGWFLKFE